MEISTIVVWFRNDLRLHDHEPLHRALSKKAQIIPVYCFDTRLFAPTSLGFPKTNAFRAKFLIESVTNLQKKLQDIGSNLIIRIGQPEIEIAKIAAEVDAKAVYCSKEVTQEELDVENKLEKKLAQKDILLTTFWTSTLFHIDDLPFPIKKIPDVFTNFRKDCESQVSVRQVLNAPTQLNDIPENISLGKIPSLRDLGLKTFKIDNRSAINWEGGEDKALAHLHTYLWEKRLLHTYKETRNELLGKDYSSKLSAWLALGAISPRLVYAEVKKYEQEIKKNESTYWLIFELIWRDYFRFIAKKYGNAIFNINGIRNQSPTLWKQCKNLFAKWVQGETGIPFIDANMRELQQTGFMSNRGRQNVASFLTKDLEIDWTWGAMYFESQLIDYDVCSNWGNWIYVAGVGNDPRENRYFNILKQAKQYDAKGEYVKHWLPELAKIPAAKVHIPHTLSRLEQIEYGITLGVDYPLPIINPEKWDVSSSKLSIS